MDAAFTMGLSGIITEETSSEDTTIIGAGVSKWPSPSELSGILEVGFVEVCSSRFSVSALRATSKACAKEVARAIFCLGAGKSADEGETSDIDVRESGESGGRVKEGEDMGLRSR
jgi:hypothetical protein